MRPVVALLILLSSLISAAPLLAAGGRPLDEVLLNSMRPIDRSMGSRQANVGAAIRELKERKVVLFRPVRVDYTDFYRVQQPFFAFGHEVVVVEEEYMAKFIGCCVSEGGGFAVRTVGSLHELTLWAKGNKCDIENFESEVAFLKSKGLRFSVPKGQYAEVSCRYRDEDRLRN